MQFKNNSRIIKKLQEFEKFMGTSTKLNEVMECIKIDALHNSLVISATNGNGNFYKSVIKDVEVAEEGTILMPAAAVYDMFSRMPEGNVKTNAKGNLTITYNGSKLSKVGLIADYANFPKVKETGSCSVLYEQLQRALKQVAHSSKKISSNVAAGSVHIVTKDNTLIIETCCDTSASRYIIRDVQVHGSIDSLIPSDSIASKISSNKSYSNDSKVVIKASDKFTVIEIDDDTYIGMNLAVKFFDVEKIFNMPFKAELTANTKDIKEMIKSVLFVAENASGKPVLRLSVKNNGSVIEYEIDTSNTNATGKIPCKCNVDTLENVEIGINPHFIKEILNFFDEDITFKIMSPVSPLLFENEISDTEYSRFIVLPIRLK